MGAEVSGSFPDGLEFKPPARPTRSEIYLALVETKGNLAKAARDLHSTRKYVMGMAADTPEIVALLEDLREGVVDQAEDNIFADVEKGDQSASRFVASTLGKKRGWSPGVEGNGKNGAIVVEIRQFTEGQGDGKDSD